jgi:hypothetical protein
LVINLKDETELEMGESVSCWSIMAPKPCHSQQHQGSE